MDDCKVSRIGLYIMVIWIMMQTCNIREKVHSIEKQLQTKVQSK